MLIAMEGPEALSRGEKDVLLNKWRRIRDRAVALQGETKLY